MRTVDKGPLMDSTNDVAFTVTEAGSAVRRTAFARLAATDRDRPRKLGASRLGTET
jgi:hypothetical protein